MTLVPLTEKHIDEGKPAKCAECPIALALKDAGINAGVHRYQSHLVGIGFVAMSPGLGNWLEHFDWQRAGTPWVFRPFTIVLDADRMSTLAEWQEAHR